MESDGKQTAKDGLPGTGRPSGGTGEKPSAKPQTLTLEEHERVLAESQSKKDKTIAQITKERDTLKASHETLFAQVTDLQRRVDEAEQDKFKDEPDELARIQRQRKIAEEEAALKKRQGEFETEKMTHAERLAKADALEWETAVFEAAKAVNGDAAKLKAKAAEYGITLQNPEKLKTLAEDLFPAKIIRRDSGRSTGGEIDTSDMSPREKIRQGLKEAGNRK